MFIEENCQPGASALDRAQIDDLLGQLPEWKYDAPRKRLVREFRFPAYLSGPEFTVRVGAMAEQQNHHPDLHIYYRKCVVEFTTHSAGGVTRNDFICAAKTDLLFEA